LLGTCGGTLNGNVYIVKAVTANCTVVASFNLTYTITPSAGIGGSISPNVPTAVSSNVTEAFTLTPNEGSSDLVTGTCGGTLSGNTFTTKAVAANCTVIAKFAQGTYTVTSSVLGTGGTISPVSNVSVISTATTSFTLKPSAGYTGSVSGTCGETLSGNTFKTNPITNSCTVVASFAPLRSQK
jgi:hypothetical protein